MLETWRWFGPEDAITLSKIRQAGAKGIVTALHDIATGDVWPLARIEQRKRMIEDAGMEWSVVESVPLHNDIKTGTGNVEQYIDNYKITLENLGKAGVKTVCYNFMPVVDWTRTNLSYTLPNAAQALRFEMSDFIAYDVFVLQRPGARQDYSEVQLSKASERYEAMSDDEKVALEQNIIAGLPGGEGSYNRQGITEAIGIFNALGTEAYRQNLFAFLKAIMPVAEKYDIKMCIHPDDPPFSLFGLPRVVSTAEDAKAILDAVPSPSNGLTLCAGSYGARADNNLVEMAKTFADRIFFVHLRNVKREEDGSFYESDHLDGDNDMIGLISALLEEDARRAPGNAIPMRPDHGHLLEDEQGQAGVKPGYSYLGRLKSLAELRGAIHVLSSLR